MRIWYRQARSRIAAIVFLCTVLVLLLPHQSKAAFGVSPPFIEPANLLQGSRYTQTIYLVRDTADVDLPIKAELDISDRVKPWFTIHDGKPITIPKGVRQYPVPVTIQIPKDAGLGVYSGMLNLATDPTRSGQVSIALGVGVIINMTVGTGIHREYEVRLMKNLDIEEGWSPRVYVKFENNGNVPEALDSATYELYDRFGAVRLAYVQKIDGFSEIEPFMTGEFTLEFPIDLHLGLGQYWGNVALYKDEKIIRTERGIFQVLKRGSLSSPTAALFANLKANWQYYAAGLVIIVIGWFMRNRRLSRLAPRR